MRKQLLFTFHLKMAIKRLQKAWRQLRMLFSKKQTNSKGVGTDLSIPEHCETENVFTFVVANRLAEALAERDALRKEKDQKEKELEMERLAVNRAQREIDELKEELTWLRELVESTLNITDFGTLCNDGPVGDKESELDRKDLDTDAALIALVPL
ncbi:unnamed protein product [Owenia fusiformis]|uniref:Uncharacterized protein n=1 Tax=Owenia fusiformis TaxID=6347 RepID=A0A8J1UJB5_OWEFU|nr:unnamed protein product [Owenia fusiformis]